LYPKSQRPRAIKREFSDQKRRGILKTRSREKENGKTIIFLRTLHNLKITDPEIFSRKAQKHKHHVHSYNNHTPNRNQIRTHPQGPKP